MKLKNEKLKKAREIKGLTQVEIASKANITTRNYQKYENEGRTPNVQTAICIAKILKVTTLKGFYELWDGNPNSSL